MKTTCERIVQDMGKLFSCSALEHYIRIRTPYLYPDGDVIDLFLREDNGQITLTDLGETLRWLRMQTISRRKTPNQRKLIDDVCFNHGVELYRGMLMARSHSEDDLVGVITRLSQAALRVADLWFTFRSRAAENINDEVEDLLTSTDIPFTRNEKLPGRSGKVWTIDFHTRQPRQSSFIYTLSTGSRAATRDITNHVLAAWYDLSHLKIGPEGVRFISLFDDRLDVWTGEQFRLLGDLSEVVFWSKPEEFRDKLAA